MKTAYNILLKDQEVDEQVDNEDQPASPRKATWMFHEETINLIRNLEEEIENDLEDLIALADSPLTTSDYEFRLKAVKIKSKKETLATITKQ